MSMEDKPFAVALYNRIESITNLMEETIASLGVALYQLPYSTEVDNFDFLCESPEKYTEDEATEIMDELQEYLEQIGESQ